MKKIIFIVSVLLISIAAVTWLYFRNLLTSENSSEIVFKVIPADASLIFEYKNEDSFYDIFNDFTLFEDVLGKSQINQLNALKGIFIDDADFSSGFEGKNMFFSIHKTSKNESEILVVSPFQADKSFEKEDLISILKSKFKLDDDKNANQPTYELTFSNQSKFFFIIHQSLLVGSFDKNLVNAAKNKINSKKDDSEFIIDFKSPRNKNSIANLYINFSKLSELINNFSDRKNPEETFDLKSINAYSSLNINYKNDAFMFSGITNVDTKIKNYFNLFLEQKPGTTTLKDILVFDAASYNFFYVSDWNKFKKGLNSIFEERKETQKMQNQLKNIQQRHSINIEKELIPVLGNEFGVVKLASGDKIGLVKTKNANRLSFLLSTISSETDDEIRHFDDSFLLYYYLGDPFKFFTRPYYAFIENHLVVANNTSALRRFLSNYKSQNFLDRTDKNINFQQYLSNQGNIFYFIHNSNSKGILKSFLSSASMQKFKSTDFDWQNVYGFSIQFSADNDKFFTNLYMNKIPKTEDYLPNVDSLFIDTLNQ